MRPLRRSKRGSALVITVGFLSVLALVGFGFAVVMRLHYDTSRYYRATADVELLSQAGILYAIDGIRYSWSNARPADDPIAGLAILNSFPAGAIAEPTESPRSTWYIDALRAQGLYDDGGGGNGRYCNLACSSYVLVHDVLGDRVAVTDVKVVDSASKINLNDDYSDAVLENVLDTLLDELGINTAEVDTSSPHLAGAAILSFRNGLSDDHFTTLSQLAEKNDAGTSFRISGMTARRFDVLKHYVTIYSWPHKPESVEDYVPSFVKPNGTGGLQYERDKHLSPININTAPYEVLVAVLANVKVGGTTLGQAKAQNIAKWILRKRDPENAQNWDTQQEFDNSKFKAWMTYRESSADSGYEWTRVHKVTAWRHYPLGPFDTWNEVADFLYSLTNAATNPPSRGSTVGQDPTHDPFPNISNFGQKEAEGVLAAVSPNALTAAIPRDTCHMGYTRLGEPTSYWTTLNSALKLRDREPTADSLKPYPTDKGELASGAQTTELSFSSRGRFEISSRTLAFEKAEFGKTTTSTAFRLEDNSRSWADNQWRGYSVLLYHGKGKGQLRGIVQNKQQHVVVAKWSTRPDTTTRYYVCGPGPVADREAAPKSEITFEGSGAYLVDTNEDKAAWDTDQWNGYRVAIYNCDSAGNPHEDSIQERIIIGTEPRTLGGGKLLVSPRLDTSSASGTHRGYVILGSYGSAQHEAAVKAYDVIYHNTQDDFTSGGCTKTHTIVGPNPTGGGVAASKHAGWVAVAPKVVSSSDFKHNFTGGITPDGGSGSYLGGVAKPKSPVAADVVTGGGSVFPDGVYLRPGAAEYAPFNCSTDIVTDLHNEGGFLSFWFRPDRDCLKGTDSTVRTLMCIKGKAKDPTTGAGPNDIRIQIVFLNEKPLLQVKFRVATGSQPYNDGSIQLTDRNGNNVTAYFRDITRSPRNGIANIDLSQTKESQGVWAPWKAGEWHHIAFAWYECYDRALRNSDGNATSTMQNDADSDYTLIDHEEVSGDKQLWIDGTKLVSSPMRYDAINLQDPDAEGEIHIGQVGAAPSGTIGGIVAYRLTTRAQVASPPGGLPTMDNNTRYYGSMPLPGQHYGEYTSPSMDLPSTTPSGCKIALGTATYTLHTPHIRWDEHWHNGRVVRKPPAYITVSLGGKPPSHPMPDPTRNPAWDGEPWLGGGGALLDGRRDSASSRPIEDSYTAGTTRIKYKLHLTAYNGAWREGYPFYCQSPIVEDVTITYLGPVVFFRWR